jgi:hypothetical protein
MNSKNYSWGFDNLKGISEIFSNCRKVVGLEGGKWI